MNRDDRFLKREYLKNLFPIMFSILGGTINALIDSIFVSQKIGPSGLAAVNVSMPVYLLICTTGALIAGGASILSAQAVGRERMEEANHSYHHALALGIVCGLVLSLLGIIGSPIIAKGLAGGGSLSSFVYAYCLVSFIGALPMVISYFPLFFLQLEGREKNISTMIVIMISTDVVFDVLFIYIFEFGLYGAATASVISTLMTCIYGFYALNKGKSNYKFHAGLLRVKNAAEIIKVGSPIALGNFYDAIRLLFLNALILYAGGNEALAVWAILYTISELSIPIVSGVPQTAAPMTGVYYFAKENSGIRILVRLQLQVGLLLAGIYSLVLLVFHSKIEELFHTDVNLFIPLLCLGVSVILNVFESIWTALMNATEQILLANLFGAFRRLLFPVIMAWIVVTLKGYPWIFLPLGSFAAIVCGLIIILRCSAKTRHGKKPLSPLLLLDDSLTRNNKIIDFSISADMDEVCLASEQIKEFCVTNDMDRKQTVRMGLAIEELMNVLIEKNQKTKSFDLRAFALDGVIGIQIRCAGEKYNPFKDLQADEDFLLGIHMLENMAEMVNHTYALRLNTINIYF